MPRLSWPAGAFAIPVQQSDVAVGCRDLRKILFGRYKGNEEDEKRERSRSPKYVLHLPS